MGDEIVGIGDKSRFKLRNVVVSACEVHIGKGEHDVVVVVAIDEAEVGSFIFECAQLETLEERRLIAGTLLLYFISTRSGDKHIAILLLGEERIFAMLIGGGDVYSIGNSNIFHTDAGAAHLSAYGGKTTLRLDFNNLYVVEEDAVLVVLAQLVAESSGDEHKT